MNLNHLYLKLFTKQKVGRQLITLFIFTILIPILVITFVIYSISYNQLAKNYEHLTAAKASQIRSVFVTTTLYVHDVYKSVAGNTDLKNLLSQEYTNNDDAQHALSQYSEFTKILSTTASLTELKLYIDQGILQSDSNSSYFYPITNEIKSEDWYQQSIKNNGNFWKSNIRIGQAGMQYWELHYYCPIFIPQSASYAILVLTVSNDHLRSLIREDNFEIYVTINNDPVFFSSNRSYAGNDFPIDLSTISNYYLKTEQMKIFDEKVIASFQNARPYSTSDYIQILVADKEALPHIQYLQTLFFVITSFALTISALLIYLFAGYFTTRIQILRLAMHKVTNNDYEIVNSIQGDDELTATFSDLKSMIHKLKETESQIYKSQIDAQLLSNQQQQMELKLLANQINPHFLYNTLETIRMKAFSEGNIEVANAIKLLGKSMHYVLDNTKTTATTLDKEVDYIKTYLAIQTLRFGSRFKYSIQIADDLDLKNYQLLPLLIQPIVENAISHGLEHTIKEGHLLLKIYKSNDELLIADVFDNGIGMTKDQLCQIEKQLYIPKSEFEHGVGLYNINNRVHLFYGEQYGLSIKSRPDFGTLVTLTIPLCNLTEEEL